MLKNKLIFFLLLLAMIQICCNSTNSDQDESIKIVVPNNYDSNLIPNELNDACKKMKVSDLIERLNKYKNIGDSLRYELNVTNEKELFNEFNKKTIILSESIKTIGIGDRSFEMYIAIYHIVRLISKNDEIVYAKVIQESDAINVFTGNIQGEEKGIHTNKNLISEFKLAHIKKYRVKPNFDNLFKDHGKY